MDEIYVTYVDDEHVDNHSYDDNTDDDHDNNNDINVRAFNARVNTSILLALEYSGYDYGMQCFFRLFAFCFVFFAFFWPLI